MVRSRRTPRTFAGARLPAAIITPVLLILSALAAIAFPAAAQARQDGYDYALVIDTSISMAGKGGGPGEVKNVFPEVQAALKDLIDQLEPGDSTVYVYPFSKELGQVKVFPLEDKQDKERAKAYVDSLKADGKGTYIYDSLGAALSALEKAHANDPPDARRVQRILLFTDGRDTSRKSMQDVVDKFELARSDNPYLYLTYVSFGTEVEPGWSDLDWVDLAGGKLRLRSVRVAPAALDFGSYASSDKATRTLQVTFDGRLADTALSLDVQSDAVSAKGGLVRLEPEDIKLRSADGSSGTLQTQVTLHVANRASLGTMGEYTGEIELTVNSKDLVVLSPQTLKFAFTMAPEPEVAIHSGDEPLSSGFGKADPYQGSQQRVTLSRKIQARFNASAADAGGNVTLSLMRVSAPAAADVRLIGKSDAGSEVTLTPEASECRLEIRIPAGQEPGDYAYSLKLQPSSGVSVTGVPVDSDSGIGAVPVTFTVPEAPAPLWQVILRWVVIALVAFVVVLGALFLILCLITGNGLGAMAKLIERRLRPRLGDARLEVTAPEEAVEMYELTDKRRFDVGPSSKGLLALPCTVRFEPQISVLRSSDDVKVSIVSDGATDGLASFLTIVRSSGIEELTSESTVAADDVIRVDMSDGRRCELVFRSINKYLST